MAKRKAAKREKPKVNKELDGFDKVNDFLDKNVDDKKLRGREDLKKGHPITEEDDIEEENDED
jgi:hypothetical protein